LRWRRRNRTRREPMPCQVTDDYNGDDSQYHFHGGGYSIKRIRMFNFKGEDFHLNRDLIKK